MDPTERSQTDPTTVTDRRPGDMINTFFAQNDWATILMALAGVVLVLFVVVRLIFGLRENPQRSLKTALYGGGASMLLFLPSLIGLIANMGFVIVRGLVTWFTGQIPT